MSKVLMAMITIILTIVTMMLVWVEYIHSIPISLNLVMVCVFDILLIFIVVFMFVDYKKIKPLVKIETWANCKWNEMELLKQEEIRLVFKVLFLLIMVIIIIILNMKIFGWI